MIRMGICGHGSRWPEAPSIYNFWGVRNGVNAVFPNNINNLTKTFYIYIPHLRTPRVSRVPMTLSLYDVRKDASRALRNPGT